MWMCPCYRLDSCTAVLSPPPEVWRWASHLQLFDSQAPLCRSQVEVRNGRLAYSSVQWEVKEFSQVKWSHWFSLSLRLAQECCYPLLSYTPQSPGKLFQLSVVWGFKGQLSPHENQDPRVPRKPVESPYPRSPSAHILDGTENGRA